MDIIKTKMLLFEKIALTERKDQFWGRIVTWGRGEEPPSWRTKNLIYTFLKPNVAKIKFTGNVKAFLYRVTISQQMITANNWKKYEKKRGGG